MTKITTGLATLLILGVSVANMKATSDKCYALALGSGDQSSAY